MKIITALKIQLNITIFLVLCLAFFWSWLSNDDLYLDKTQ